MPFKSEKQRRFMWAEHPEIARKWADKYDTPKDLPMYAKKKQTKKSEECTNRNKIVFSILGNSEQETSKKADSKQEKVTIPHSEEPVYAGEEREKGKLQEHFDDKPEVNDSKPENSISSLLHKMSVVLSPRLAKALEQRRARKEGRQPAYQPKVQGLKPFYAQQPTVAPPMAMQQAQLQQPQQNVTYPSRPTNAVGGGNNPAANPINSFGALSMSGNLNGNAAFGAKNSPDSSKMATVLKWAAADTPCSCGCGDTVATCKCSKDCSCRKPGGSCYKAEKKAYGVWDKYTVAERTPWLDHTPDKLPAYLALASELAAQKGYRLGFTNERYGKTMSGQEYADKLRKGRVPADYYDNEFPAFFDMEPLDKRTLWQKLTRQSPTLPAQSIDDLYGKRMRSAKRWEAHVDKNWPVYQAYHEIYGPQKKASTTKARGNKVVIKRGEAEKQAGKSKPGLWANIHAKRKRGEKPAKPGDKDYPDSKSWNKTVKSSLAAAIKSAAVKQSDMQNYTLPNYPYDPELHKQLESLDHSWVSPSDAPELPEPVARQLQKYLQNLHMTPTAANKNKQPMPMLPRGQKPDALDAMATLLELDNAKSAGIKLSKSPAWQRSEGKNSEGGLNAKGRASYNKSTGGNLKAPVTQKNPKGKAKSRRASFCARMGGMKKKLTGEKTKNDPDSRINKALRKWNC